MDAALNAGADMLKRIEIARRELLDLSFRNRLLNTPRESSRARKIDIIDERSEEVFRLLVHEHKSMSFLPGLRELDGDPDGPSRTTHLAQPEEESGDGTRAARHTDVRLQTQLPSERLQARLLDLYYDAQTYEQERGVSILYLAMGFLKWFEAASSNRPRYAPLFLIPVDLERQSAANRFHLRYRDEDVTTNLSLQAKLKGEFGIGLPDVPDMEDLSPTAYFDSVTRAIAGESRWEVISNDMVLWFFSFAKYLMYRDLDPSNWPAHSPLAENPILSSLLGEGVVSEPPLCGDDDKIDRLIPPSRMVHVTDADSSQTVVIEEVRQGRHLVVQGPPGTGKSQTITNVIATAVKEGKKVLFVAEKMAALEVVRSRLERLGLGALCLELHSHKANKKAVLDDLARTLNLGRPKAQRSEEHIEALEEAIQRLNGHSERMNTPLEPSGLTPFQIIGRLTHLYGKGVEATGLCLPHAESWTGRIFRRLCSSITELEKYVEELGPPGDHPWRGVRRTEPILHADLNGLQTKMIQAKGSLTSALESYQEMLALLGVAAVEAPSMRDVQRLAQFGHRLVKAPTMDRAAIASPEWDSRRPQIDSIVSSGREHAQRLDRLHAILTDAAWDRDLAGVRQCLSRHGRSLLRWFRKEYRKAVATFQGLFKGDAPRTVEARLAILDEIARARADTRSFEEDAETTRLGREAFGTAWCGARSDWPALSAIVRWEADCRGARLGWDYRGALSRIGSAEFCQSLLKTVSTHLKPASSTLHEIAKTLELDCPMTFGSANLHDVPIIELLARIDLWQEHPEGLSKWVGYQLRQRQLEDAGLGPIASGLHDGSIDRTAALDVFQVAYYQSLIGMVCRDHKEIAQFDGQAYEQWIEEFRALDQGRIELARLQVATSHYDGIPRAAVGGEMAVVRREIEKKKRHKPIRQLIKEAGTAILAIKPVFMMSPISIAQFLEPGCVTFDLMLIDEASQVNPVDALGAMARARQVVIVGDDKQLPPTRFFSKVLDEEDAGDDSPGSVNAGDLDSILGLCVAQGLPQRWLRWHYRSRHHSLIAVSNREFYENRLHVIPSPTTVTATHGLHFRLVKDGVFDRGNTATNRVEAKVIAQAVIDHARCCPNKSLGVAAFSISQRDAIRDELELLQRENANLASFFSSGRPEPVFVKNLENIQGDERDVIFISVGYARDDSGYLAMGFGPLSIEGGERRLNVLISRARDRCEVFSSITAHDIDLARARSRGAAAFKAFLHYAATGILDHPGPTGADHDSDFERQVAVAVEARGYEVHRQVGTAGFFIDLAVVDPARPGRYLLGIECDGANYHSSRSARDRDRLREMVLKDKGWRIHRVWSTDWFHRQNEQLRKTIAAIEKARLELEVDDEDAIDDTPIPMIDLEVDIERGEASEVGNGEIPYAWVTPYEEARLAVPSPTPIHETGLGVLSKIVARVVEIEGPIHRDEVARRITSLWGQTRTGSRIAEAVSRAIQSGIKSGVLRSDSDFVSYRKQVAVPVRSRSGVSSQSLKRPEMISPAELRQAVRFLVADHIGLTRDEVAVMVSRALGFKVAGAKLKEAIERVLVEVIEEGSAVERDGKLFKP